VARLAGGAHVAFSLMCAMRRKEEGSAGPAVRPCGFSVDAGLTAPHKTCRGGSAARLESEPCAASSGGKLSLTEAMKEMHRQAYNDASGNCQGKEPAGLGQGN